MIGSSYSGSNRFASLRDRSVSSDRRQRSVSVKRKLYTDPTPSQSISALSSVSQTQPQSQDTLTFSIKSQTLETLTTELAKSVSLCDKIETELNSQNMDNAPKEFLGDILTILKSLTKTQEIIISSATTQAPPQKASSYAEAANPTFKIPQGVARKKPRTKSQSSTQHTVPPEKEPSLALDKQASNNQKYLKFKEAVKEAEKSTLIFNLNLGRYPIMNQETMGTRATLALSKMAAEVENLTTSIPSEEARDTLDDVLGLAKGIRFYGKQTKTYTNSKDAKNSGAFCTLPVRYEFKDRNTRTRAENVLRERCKVQCSTPYPTILRECMKQAADEVKRKFPQAAVRINVDSHNFCLKISKKEPGGEYEHLQRTIPLPIEALDIQAKKPPLNFKLDFEIRPSPNRPSRRDSQTSPSQQGSPSTSQPETTEAEA